MPRNLFKSGMYQGVEGESLTECHIWHMSYIDEVVRHVQAWAFRTSDARDYSFWPPDLPISPWTSPMDLAGHISASTDPRANYSDTIDKWKPKKVLESDMKTLFLQVNHIKTELPKFRRLRSSPAGRSTRFQLVLTIIPLTNRPKVSDHQLWSLIRGDPIDNLIKVIPTLVQCVVILGNNEWTLSS